MEGNKGGKCSCLSGRKFRACHGQKRDKSCKNKSNHRGYHNDNGYQPAGAQGFGSTGYADVDKLDQLIKDMERQISNIKGKNANHKKNQRKKQLDKLRIQRDRLLQKMRRDREKRPE